MSEIKKQNDNHINESKNAATQAFAPGGVVDQAVKAKTEGKLSSFMADLWKTVSPTVLPLVVSIIQSVLAHIVVPPAAPETKTK